MKKIALLALFLAQYNFQICGMDQEKQEDNFLRYPLAQQIYSVFYPLKCQQKEEKIAHFEKKLYIYHKTMYPIDNEMAFARSYILNNYQKDLLSVRDIPTLLLHGSHFLVKYEKDRKNKEAFVWAYRYLYAGVYKGDPFCEALFSRLLKHNDISREAKELYEKYEDMSQANKFYERAKQPREYWNSFTKKREILFLSPGIIDNYKTHTKEPLKVLDSWKFGKAKKKDSQTIKTSIIYPTIVTPCCIKEESDDSIKINEKKLPQKPILPAKNNEILQNISLRQAKSGQPDAIYSQIILTKDIYDKLYWTLKLYEISTEKYNDLKQKALEHITENMVEILKNKNAETIKNLCRAGVLELYLPLAHKAEELLHICTQTIKIACHNVYQDYDKIFKNTGSIAQFLNHKGVDTELKQPEIFLLKAENAFKHSDYSELKLFLLAALNASSKGNKNEIKKAIIAHIENLRKNNIAYDDMKESLRQKKIYLFTEKEIISFVNNLVTCKVNREANAVYKHEAFKKLLDDKQPETRYQVAQWLTLHKNAITNAVQEREKLLQQLVQENFLPAQIEALAQQAAVLTQSEKEVKITKKNKQKKIIQDPYSIYIEKIQQLLPLVTTSFFEKYPQCRPQAQNCLQTIITLAESRDDAAHAYSTFLLTGIPGFVKKQYTKAFEYYFKQDPTHKNIKDIMFYEQELSKIVDMDLFLKGHCWFIKYYNSQNAIEKICEHAQKLLNKKYSQNDFINKLFPAFIKKNGPIEILIHHAQHYNSEQAALLYADFIEYAQDHEIEKADSFSFAQLPRVYTVLTACYQLHKEESSKQKLAQRIGLLCAKKGKYYLGLCTKENYLNLVPKAKEAFHEGALYDFECAYQLARLKIKFPTPGSTDSFDGLILLGKAKKNNHIDAIYHYGKYVFFGPLIDNTQINIFYHDPQRGYQSLEKACKLGSEKAKKLLEEIGKPKNEYSEPIDIDDPQACYEYGRYLYESAQYHHLDKEKAEKLLKEACIWLEHAEKGDIPQVNFYQGIINFIDAEKSEKDVLCSKFDKFLCNYKKIANKTEQKQLVRISMRILMNLSLVSKHIPSTCIAIDHFITNKELLSKEKFRSALATLCYNALLENTKNQQVKKDTRLLDCLGNNLEKLEKIAIEFNDYDLYRIVALVHKNCVEQQVCHTDKIEQLIRAKKYVQNMPEPQGAKFKGEMLQSLDKQCIQCICDLDPKDGLKVFDLLDKENLMTTDFAILKIFTSIKANTFYEQEYAAQDVLRIIDEAIEKYKKDIPLEILVLKKKLLLRLNSIDPKDYPIQKYNNWCNELKKNYKINDLINAEKKLNNN